MFEYETELAAQVATTNPFAEDPGPQLRQEAEADHEQAVTRVLLALALTHEGPVQEHLTMRSIRYAGGGAGQNPEPLAPFVVTFPYFISEGPRLDELKRTAELVADIAVERLGVGVRRYLLAYSERTRPADQIVDYATAIESLTRGGAGATHGEALAALIATHDAERADIDAQHRRLKDARNTIIHEGKTPRDARQVALLGRQLVRRALDASVQRELHAQP